MIVHRPDFGRHRSQTEYFRVGTYGVHRSVVPQDTRSKSKGNNGIGILRKGCSVGHLRRGEKNKVEQNWSRKNGRARKNGVRPVVKLEVFNCTRVVANPTVANSQIAHVPLMAWPISCHNSPGGSATVRTQLRKCQRCGGDRVFQRRKGSRRSKTRCLETT